jgi:hypothetical protein
MKIAFVIVLLFSFIIASTALVTGSQNFGQTYTCSDANDPFHHVIWNGPLLISVDMWVRCPAESTVTFGIASSAPPIPVTLGDYALSIGSTGPLFIGFVYSFTGSVSDTNLTWSGSLTSAAVAALMSHAQMGFLQLNAQNDVIGFLPAAIRDGSISAMIPSAGTYALIHVKPTADASFSVGIVLAPNVEQLFQFKSADGSYTELYIRIRSSMPTTLSCMKQTTHSAMSSVPNHGLNVFFSFSMVPAVSDYEVQMTYIYTDAQLTAAGIRNPMTLQWYQYSSSTSSWNTNAQSVVNPAIKGVATSTTNVLGDWAISASNLCGPEGCVGSSTGGSGGSDGSSGSGANP